MFKQVMAFFLQEARGILSWILFCHNKILLFKQFMTFFLQEARGARIVVSYLLSNFLLCES